MFTEKRGGGAAARQRQRQSGGGGVKNEMCTLAITVCETAAPTSAEQSINPASVCFMRQWVRASLPEGTNSSTGQ